MFTFWSSYYEFADGTDPHGSKATLFIDVGTSPVYREIRMKRTWVTVTARVIDATTGTAIKGAWIPDYVRSDAEGRVRITMRAGTKDDVRIIAEGYITQEDTITTTDADTEHIVRLTPIGKTDLQKRAVKITIGGVKGSVNWPVPKAKVTIGRQSLVTDAYGVVKLELAPGFHSYTVSANGFKDEKGKFEVSQANSKELQSKEISQSISIFSQN
jgi:hypothetical protein